MKVKLIETCTDKSTRQLLVKGTVIEIDEARAYQAIADGLAVEYKEEVSTKPKKGRS